VGDQTFDQIERTGNHHRDGDLVINWHCLVTRDDRVYEPGVFDIRGPAPRPTRLAEVVRDLALGRRPGQPVIGGPGWWQRPAAARRAA
jgi:hypothetical protein